MKEIKIYEIPSIDHMELVDDPYIGMIIYVANIDFIATIDDPYIGMIFYVADVDTYY